MTPETFLKLFQLSISPIALISGAGLLLLSISNRLGRAIDRARLVANEGSAKAPVDAAQLRVLVRRASVLRSSVFFVGLSVFLSALIIIELSCQLFLKWSIDGWIVATLFGSAISLFISMVFFLFDVSMALSALRLEVAPHLD